MNHQIITPAIINDIARLARLGLSDDERPELVTTLQNVLSHFTKIQAIDTKKVPTSDDVTGLTNITRSDHAHPERLTVTSELLDRAPETKDGHIKVKAVFYKRFS